MNDKAIPVTFMLSALEYGEVLAKLANELEAYSDADGGSQAKVLAPNTYTQT
jgi:hypothetical protein